MANALAAESAPTLQDFSLAGRTAVVTGAASGIGRAIAEKFATAGASVAALDVNGAGATATVGVLSSHQVGALALEADVTSDAAIQNAIRTCESELGPVDILVNNAGVGQLGTVTELDEDTWDRTLAINLKSVFLCARTVIPSMLHRGGGKIINIASVAGVVASPGRAAYCASKGGVVMLTRAMAVDYAAAAITVNAICPGVIVTAMTEDSLRDPEIRQEKLDKTPIGRLGAPADIAAAALYLASPAADFVTGSCLVVDGGWSID